MKSLRKWTAVSIVILLLAGSLPANVFAMENEGQETAQEAIAENRVGSEAPKEAPPEFSEEDVAEEDSEDEELKEEETEEAMPPSEEEYKETEDVSEEELTTEEDVAQQEEDVEEEESLLLEEESAEAEDVGAAASYSYVVQPLLTPFNGYVYVQTDNPDPKSFRLIDKSSKYITADSSAGYGQGVYHLPEILFSDVVYENESTYRVAGGYIFVNLNFDSDGGTLVVQEPTTSNPAGINYSNGQIVSYSGDMSKGWADTSARASCEKLQTYTDWLIDAYTTSSMSFFEKMDAVESGLSTLAVYPRSFYDTTKKNADHPYPFFATSPYQELSFNRHYDIYERSATGLLISRVYPFILDSASYPGTMGAVAKKLNANCTVSSVSGMHWIIDVSLDGTTRSYGYGTPSGSQPIYSQNAKKDYLFDNSANDYAFNGTKEKLKSRLLEYGTQAVKDNESLQSQLAAETVANKITPGGWVRVATEGGFSYGKTYGYIALGPTGSDISIASNAWVDGRYINAWEQIQPGAKFEDYPKADIIMRNVSYTDRYGKAHVSDIVYEYDSATDTWRAPYYYNARNWYSSGIELPDTFILTRAQVAAMQVDKNTNQLPEEGYIYDGTVPCGTPFSNVKVTGIRLSATQLTVYVGETADVVATVLPENATHAEVNWKSGDTSVATCYDDKIYTYKKGKVTLTATTVDGAYSATCVVTVVDPPSLTNAKVSNVEEKSYTGSAIAQVPTVSVDGKTLELNTDYEISYANNIKAGTATMTISGKGLYIGTKEITFKINPIVISKAMVSNLDSARYTGKALTPAPSVKWNSKTLKSGTDYTLSYKNNIKKGTATVIITGKGNFKGSIAKTFKIVSTPTWKRLSGASGTGALGTMEQITRTYGKASTAIVVTNADFKDALASAALAGAYDAPILTTAKGSLSAQTKSELLRMGVTRVIIVGNTSDVSTNTEMQIQGLSQVQSVTRITGSGSSGKAVNAAKAIPSGSSGDTIIIATQKSFKDAMSISSYSYAAKTPILYVENNLKLSDATLKYISDEGYRKAIIVGGPKAIPDDVVYQLWMRTWAYNINRLAGKGCYGTSGAIAEWTMGKLKNGTSYTGGKAYQYTSVVFQPAVKMSANKLGISRGDGWKDALCGAALCGKNKAIILLADGSNSSNASIVKKYKNNIVYGYVFGGTQAVPKKVMNKLMAASK